VQGGMWIPTNKEQLRQDAQRKEDEAEFVPPDPRLIVKLRGKPDQEVIGALRELLQEHQGSRRVAFSIESVGGSRVVETDYTVTSSPELIGGIEELLGRGSVGG